MNNNLEELYHLRKSLDSYTLDELILRGLEEEIDLTFDDIDAVYKNHGETGYVAIPNVVGDFMEEVVTEDINVLVPWNVYGDFIDRISKKIEKSILISAKATYSDVTKLMLKDDKHHVCVGEPINVLGKLHDSKFNLICGFPPMGMRTNFEKNNQSFKGEFSHQLILKSSDLLEKNGKMLFIVNHNFFNKSGNNAVLPLLENNGIYLDAAFYLPPGMHSNTGIGTYLVALSHIKYKSLFVSELKAENIEEVITNWKSRKKSKILQKGKLVGQESFFSYERLEKEIEIKKFVEKSNLTEVPIKDIAVEINNAPKKSGLFKEQANTVYLPNIGMSDAVDNLNELKNTPQNYFQIVLKENVSSSYLVKWFNTELGILLRESLMSGHIGHINKSAITNANVYLPEKNIQQEILNIQSKVDEFRNELLSIESRAWNHPNGYEKLNKRLEKLNREDGFSEWLETLPFPLASILYKYFATTDFSSKKEYLLHFFEAFAQFQVVLLMSAYSKNGKNLEKKYIYEIDANKLSRATFGTWVHIGQNMASKLRQLLNDLPEQTLRLFQHKRKFFIEMISSKQIYNILDKTKGYRNDWKGHGGVESKTEAKNRLILLENELHSLRKFIGDTYENYLLIQPGLGHFSSGLYNCNCKLLKGSRSTFREENIEVSTGLDIENLYLLEKSSYEPLEILPFIKLMPSPSTQVNACYFYNRIDNDGVRMVSYYFDQDADVTIQDGSIKTILDNISSINEMLKD